MRRVCRPLPPSTGAMTLSHSERERICRPPGSVTSQYQPEKT